MQDIIVGIVFLVIGSLFCFRGYLTMRVIIPIWGAFTGFVLGASLITTFTDEGFLRNLTGWLVGMAVGFAFGFIAYLYYEISVIITMASIGFTLGTTLMVALDVTWSWIIILVGVVAAIALAFLAIVSDLPTVLLLGLTALTGASVIVLGLMLLTGQAETANFRTEVLVDSIDDQWWWWLIYVALAAVGMAVQIRLVATLRGSMRAAWIEAGGREIRPRA